MGGKESKLGPILGPDDKGNYAYFQDYEKGYQTKDTTNNIYNIYIIIIFIILFAILLLNTLLLTRKKHISNIRSY
jgi:hypothetical protein